MDGHMYMIFISALIPMIIGAVWYDPRVFGKVWMSSSGITDNQTKTNNIAVLFVISYVFAVFISFALIPVVIHQSNIMSLYAMEPDFGTAGAASTEAYNAIMETLGDRHRTFGHGALLGGMMGGLFIAMPVIGTIALFEKRSWNYIIIHSAYWIISLTLMGGVLCQFF